MAAINLKEVGAFPSVEAARDFSVRIGLYLPGIRGADGFDVVVLIIHKDDRFNPAVPAQSFHLQWVSGHALDLWTITQAITTVAGTNFGQPGDYLYRFQLWWTPAGGSRQKVTQWFTDPFARATDVGELSAFTLAKAPAVFEWTDAAYKTPALNDLIVYELQVEEFNDTFDGVVERLEYLQSLGVNCLELMPVTSVQLDFDWGYGPLHNFAPNARLGGGDGLKRLVNACHAAGIGVILDVVYQHVAYEFAYKQVYDDVNNRPGAPRVPNPMIGADGNFGPQCDFSLTFTQDYFAAANQMWLDEYHVDGFRYDEVTDLYSGPTDTAYAKLSYDTYQYSLSTARFQTAAGYSGIIQCAEALGKARDVLTNTYTSCAWQDDLLNKSEDMIKWNYADANFAHLLDPSFNGYPGAKTVNTLAGALVPMPVAPFQYLETHDHSQLIVFAGGNPGDGYFPPGDRSRYFKLQPYAIALYTLQGVPMLWQGQEFADYYNLPSNGEARIGLRRDTHWEFFYDDYGVPLIRLYRRLGLLRKTYPALRGRDSYFYYLQSLQNTQIIAYHRHLAPAAGVAEQFVMVLLNFSDSPGTITLPFPKAGTWKEMIDADVRTVTVVIPADGATQAIVVPSNYGCAYVWAD